MLSIINSSTVIGIEGIRVKVEVDINKGIPCFNIVGLAGTSIKESMKLCRWHRVPITCSVLATIRFVSTGQEKPVTIRL